MASSTQAVFDALHSGNVAGAARLAAQRAPRTVFGAVNYEVLEQKGELYRDLVVAWLPLAGVLERPEIAGWLANMSVADLAHLDLQGEAALLLSTAVGDATHRLASILDEIAGPLADGPDAGITQAQARQLEGCAAALRAVPLGLRASGHDSAMH